MESEFIKSVGNRLIEDLGRKLDDSGNYQDYDLEVKEDDNESFKRQDELRKMREYAKNALRAFARFEKLETGLKENHL